MTLFCENEAIPRDKNKLLTYLNSKLLLVIVHELNEQVLQNPRRIMHSIVLGPGLEQL